MPGLLHHPWLRLVLGVLAAAAVGVLAARIAGPVGDRAGAGPAAGAAAADGGSSGGGSRGARTGGAPGAAGGGGSSGVAVSAGGDGATVHVTGAVRRPGVYELRAGARVQEAVRKAGGATRRADRAGLNLAAEVRDGQQVVMPVRVRPRAGGGASTAAAKAPLDLNAATPEELDGLEGVGPATAEKIVALREERGGLGGVDDLDEIPGIGPKTLESLRQQLGG